MPALAAFHRAILLLGLAYVLRPVSLSAADPGLSQQISKGRLLYLQHCVLCHQSAGQGSPGTFPPLAKSDFLMADKARSIRVVIEGLSGEITVNGVKFNGVMPPAILNDQQLADVLTFARNSWGNTGEGVTAEEVKAVRAKSRYPDLQVLLQASTYAPLPKPPDGFTVREVARLNENGTRLAGDGQGKALYVLAANGNVWRVELPGGKLTQILWGDHYLDLKRGDPFAVGLTLDRQKRLYVVVNQRNESGSIVTNEVTIFRTTGTSASGDPSEPKPWLRTAYPYGIGPFNHAVGNIAEGPDGFLYVISGSRTDGNEPGQDPRYYTGGEVPLTSSIWRLDPRADKPEIEVFARGTRNAYGFCWNDRGEMFATDNGPDAHAPEELNRIERGRHYGFPYQFSDWTNKPYAYTPDAPADLRFTLPVANLGPDGGFNGRPLHTFDPHSSPAGIVHLGEDFPDGYRGSFMLVRFGNLIAGSKDVGFDLLQATLRTNAAGNFEGNFTTVLAPLARPLDVCLNGKGRIYLLEFARTLNNKGDVPMLPGRILELAVKPASGK